MALSGCAKSPACASLWKRPSPLSGAGACKKLALTAAMMTSAAAAIGVRQYRHPECANGGTPSGVPPSCRFGAVMSGASAPPPPAVDACGPKDDRGEADPQDHQGGAG